MRRVAFLPGRGLVACAALTLLASCGGGEGGGMSLLPSGPLTPPPASAPAPAPGALAPPVPPPPAPQPELGVDCAGEHCGAVAPGRYGGSGTGVWRYVNAGTEAATLPVSIQGVAGREVTVIYANPTALPATMPRLVLEPALPKAAAVARQRAAPPRRYHSASDMLARAVAGERLAASRRGPPRARAAAPRAQAQAQAPARVGDTRHWWYGDSWDAMEARAAVLRKALRADDGRAVYLWVEEGEHGEGKVDDAKLEAFAQRIAGGPQSIYAMATRLAGALWGPHADEGLIPPEGQPLHIVYVNFNRDQEPFGYMGRFIPVNNFLRDPNDEYLKYSNEALVFFMDTETIYLGEPWWGIQMQTSALAHEMTHLANFYRRSVLMSEDGSGHAPRFAPFLEETSALMMQDIVDADLDPGYHTLYSYRFPEWLHKSLGNCSYTVWNAALDDEHCASYDTASSFGGYLLRHYGLDFYRSLLRSTFAGDSLQRLDDAILRAGGSGFAEAFRRWGTMAALLPDDTSPQGFGMPQRLEEGFWLPPIPGPMYSAVREWPSSVPAALAPHAQFPFRRTPVGDRYEELLSVPPGVALTVVVQ